MNSENELAFGEFRFFGVMSQTPISTLSITLEGTRENLRFAFVP